MLVSLGYARQSCDEAHFGVVDSSRDSNVQYSAPKPALEICMRSFSSIAGVRMRPYSAKPCDEERSRVRGDDRISGTVASGNSQEHRWHQNAYHKYSWATMARVSRHRSRCLSVVLHSRPPCRTPCQLPPLARGPASSGGAWLIGMIARPAWEEYHEASGSALVCGAVSRWR